MLIGDLFKGREEDLYPTQDTILKEEIEIAMAAYPNAQTGIHALAMAYRTLRKNHARTMRDNEGMKAFTLRGLEKQTDEAKRT